MKLRRELSLLHVFCIATGAMISSGLFVLAGMAHAVAGPSVVVSYLIAGLLAVPGMLSQAELVSAMPKAGGTYFYVTRSMGPAVGTVDGLVTWMSLCLKSAFALAGLAALAATVLHVENIAALAVPLCVVFVAINLVGMKEAGVVQVVLVLGLVAVLIMYIVKGLPAVNARNFEPLAPAGAPGIFAAAGLVFIAYGGLLKVASIAEEVKNPARTVPLGMILSLLFVTILYMLVVFVTTGVLSADKLDHSLTPIADGAEAFMGAWGRVALSVAAMLAFVTTANAGIMAASRYPLAASRDGLLPEFLQRISPRFKTPHFSILVTGAFMALALLLGLDFLVRMASGVLILSYIFACLSVVMLREGRVQNYQPSFRSPLYPWVQIAGVVGYVVLLWQLGRTALFAGSIPVVAGLFLYWFHGRIKANREYALLHLIERITAAELTDRALETELKEIIRERDEISLDRFDREIDNCVILDVKGPQTLADFMRIVAEALAEKIDVPPAVFMLDLLSRENQSTTAISPTLAIPHIIVSGEKRFQMLVARCREGVRFSDDAAKVHAVFVLAGSLDERTFHLRALTAIGQIVQDPQFDKKWLAARTKEDLRDLILLGKRKR